MRGLVRPYFSLAETVREYRIFKAAGLWLRAIERRNRNARKSLLVPLKAAQLPTSEKASKNNGQNWTVCKLSSYSRKREV